ncbi:MAG: carboxysome peptide B [Halothiobacillaceae bacterium]|nr:MAG: carboxysome peptide B [Halothiobacillaceae bacterium]
MEILQVMGPLVCTQRHPGLYQTSLRVVRDVNGRLQVAVDACGSRVGNWVFVASGSAARYASGDFAVLTDLTIAGIIDGWNEEHGQAPLPANSTQ